MFTRRAIIIDAACLAAAGEQALQDLRWLSGSYLLVLRGEDREDRLRKVGIRHEKLGRDDLDEFLGERAIELYASWLIGATPAPGLRAVLPCGSSGAVRRALRHIREAESRSRIIIDYERLGEVAAAMRRSGLKIVFTNGVFDLLHIGHLRLLERAKALGDELIVAINSDDSTKRIKGNTRPVVPQFARAEILTRLRQVDYCCIFTETDPKRILSIVRPDVLAKGSEYTLKRVVGARYVMHYGGRVARLPLVQGWSTTSTIRGINQRAEGRGG